MTSILDINIEGVEASSSTKSAWYLHEHNGPEIDVAFTSNNNNCFCRFRDRRLSPNMPAERRASVRQRRGDLRLAVRNAEEDVRKG